MLGDGFFCEAKRMQAGMGERTFSLIASVFREWQLMLVIHFARKLSRGKVWRTQGGLGDSQRERSIQMGPMGG